MSRHQERESVQNDMDLDMDVDGGGDVLEDITNMESKFYQEGYQSGYDHGKLHGLFEGRELGKEKAWELWEEIGYYEGFALTYVELFEGIKTSLKGDGKGGGLKRKDDRALNHAQILLSLISTFPTINPSQPQPQPQPQSSLIQTEIDPDTPKKFGELNYNIDHGKTLSPDEIIFFYDNPPNSTQYKYIGMMFSTNGSKIDSIIFEELINLVRSSSQEGKRGEWEIDNAKLIKFPQAKFVSSSDDVNSMEELFQPWLEEEIQNSQQIQNQNRDKQSNENEENPEIDLSTLTSNIRARYKLLCSSLNLKPRLQNAQFVEAIPGSGAAFGNGQVREGMVEGIEGPIKGVDTRQLRF